VRGKTNAPVEFGAKLSIGVIDGYVYMEDLRFDAYNEGVTLIEAYPKTGRTHQIRVHFSYIGHPVIGDKDYGNKESEKVAKETGLVRRFLHSKRIVFNHPITNEIIDLNDELPDDLKNCRLSLKKII